MMMKQKLLDISLALVDAMEWLEPYGFEILMGSSLRLGVV